MTFGNRKIVLPPCPACDVPGTGDWLSSMAESGWFLEPDGFFAGLAFFRRGTPLPGARYRLDALPPQGLLDDGILIPAEKLELCASLGWEYVAKRSFFAVYRCTGTPDTPELHTDPTLEALSMRALYRNRVINMIFTCVLLFVFFGALAVGGTVSGALFGKGMAFLLAEIAVILFAIALDLREMIVLSRLYRRLSSGTPPESADWRAHAARNRAVFLTGVFLLLAFIVLFFTGIAHKRSGVTELPGSVVPDLPYPYPVTAALFPDGETAYDEAFYARSFVRQTKDLFAPQVIETEEYVTVGRDGETVFSGFVDVCFCETSFSFLADRVAAEWLTEAGHESHYSGTEESVCPNGVRVLRYTALFPTLLFTYDRYAVKVTFCAFGDTAFPEEAAVEAFAAVIGG